jgi:hypothetical protein
MPLEKQGTCLCGATRLKVTVDNTHVSACHCSMCRKWTGGPLLAVQCAAPPQIEGPAPSVYDSSPWAQRGFCGQCGTHLFYRLKESDCTLCRSACSMVKKLDLHRADLHR